MNKTDQQKNNTYIDYWTKSGKSSKEANQSIKIAKTVTYTDKSGTERTRTTFQHPTLKDITFSKPHIRNSSLTEEEKKERFDKAPFSDYHDKLINSTYSRENRIAKQQMLKAIHDEKIQSIMFKKATYKLAVTKYNQGDCPNLLVVKLYDSNNLPYDFSSTPSRLSLEELRKKAEIMNLEFSKSIRNYAGIEIWEKSEHMKKYNGGNYRFCIFREKQDTKSKKETKLAA